MSRVYNFSAGPGMLADEVLLQAQAEMLDWRGTGMSVMELGHRGSEYKAVIEQSEADLREIMDIPKNYHVLFLAGGASVHFSMVPLNLLSSKKTADYVNTGVWSEKALVEAKIFGNVNIAAELNNEDMISIPPQNAWKLNPQADYLHYTPNETIGGVEFNWVPETGGVPLVADMSSMILSKPIDVNQFDLIYAGAQKNMGQAGISIAIIRDDLLKNPLPGTPTLYSYKVQAENQSLYNTPPTYSWYIAGLVFAWVKKSGGVKYFGELNQRKSSKLYQCIDQHKEFYINNIRPDCRSRMNVIFNLKSEELLKKFLELATKEGLANLRGHRAIGGIRASIYNAMPEKGVDALVSFMQEFVRKFG